MKTTIEHDKALAGGNDVSAWYAICTRSRHEKAVAKQLAERNIESFLPMYGQIHKWKDRKKLVSSPLFPGYVFVRISWHDRLAVLQLSSVARFVSFGDSPAELPEAELQALRSAAESGAFWEPHPHLKIGRRVRIRSGPLQDSEGILIRKKGGHRLVLSIDLIQRSVAVEIDLSDVTPIAEIGSTQGPQRYLAGTSSVAAPGLSS